MHGGRNIIIETRSDTTTLMEVEWTMEMEGVPDFAKGLIEIQLSKTTEHAYNKISSAVSVMEKSTVGGIDVV